VGSICGDVVLNVFTSVFPCGIIYGYAVPIMGLMVVNGWNSEFMSCSVHMYCMRRYLAS
jgi:hypothetical protein